MTGPAHDVRTPIIFGASAGGMTARVEIDKALSKIEEAFAPERDAAP